MGVQLRSLTGAFTYCSSLTSIDLPEGLETVGRYAFVGCTGLTCIRLPEGLKEMAPYAFAALNGTTFYTAQRREDSVWGTAWNASYRPVIWGCEFSSEGYLTGFVKEGENMSNVSSHSVLSAPTREGYTFAGWAAEPGAQSADYMLEDTLNIPNGVTLYAVWTKNIS